MVKAHTNYSPTLHKVVFPFCPLTESLPVLCVVVRDDVGPDAVTEVSSVELRALQVPGQVPLVGATTSADLRRPRLSSSSVQRPLLVDARASGSSTSSGNDVCWNDRQVVATGLISSGRRSGKSRLDRGSTRTVPPMLLEVDGPSRHHKTVRTHPHWSSKW